LCTHSIMFFYVRSFASIEHDDVMCSIVSSNINIIIIITSFRLTFVKYL